MSPPVLVDQGFSRRSAAADAVAVVTKDRASMRGFVLGGLACFAIVAAALYYGTSFN